MSDNRIPLSFTPHGLDVIAMALQSLQSLTGATINDIREQVQALQAPGLTPTNDEARAADAGGPPVA